MGDLESILSQGCSLADNGLKVIKRCFTPVCAPMTMRLIPSLNSTQEKEVGKVQSNADTQVFKHHLVNGSTSRCGYADSITYQG